MCLYTVIRGTAYVLALLVGVVFSGSHVDVTVSNCTKSTDEAQLSSITLTPHSPVKTNANFSVVASGKTDSDITKGTFKAVAKFLGITVLTEEGDLCAPKTIVLPDKAGFIYYKGVECPLKKGANVAIEIGAMVTSSAPDKKVKISMQFTDTATKHDVMCLDMVADVKKVDDEE